MTLTEMQEYSRRKAAKGNAQKWAKKASHEQMHAGLLEAAEKFFAAPVGSDAHAIAKHDLMSRISISRKVGFPK